MNALCLSNSLACYAFIIECYCYYLFYHPINTVNWLVFMPAQIYHIGTYTYKQVVHSLLVIVC